MLTGLAKLIAHSLFALRRSGASVLSLIVVTTVATAFATVGAATLLDGRRAPTEVSNASALGTFISANGTTSTEWQIAGPSGPGFVDDAGALDLLPNVSLAGAPGTGSLQMGQMTGSTTLPTGDLTWSSLLGNASLTGNAFTITSTTTSSIDGPTLNLGASTATTINLGNSGAVIDIGSTQTVLGNGSGAPVIGETFTVTNPGASGSLFYTYAHPASSTSNFQISIQDYDGAGNSLAAEYDFWYQRIASAGPTLVGSSTTTATTTNSTGTVTSWGLTVTVSSNNLQLKVVGPTTGTAKVIMQVF